MTRGRIIEWSHAARTFPGQSISGDRCFVAPYEGGVLAGVVDGLGHGIEAARSAEMAVSYIVERPDDPLKEIIKRCHLRLRGLRGIAATLAAFTAATSTMTWLAVGNVSAVLIPGTDEAERRRSHLVLRGGVVGDRLPSLKTSTLPVVPGDTLLLATDGVSLDFAETWDGLSSPDVMAQRIIERHSTGRDDALIMVVRYMGDA